MKEKAIRGNNMIFQRTNEMIVIASDRIIKIKNGLVESNEINKHPKNIDEVKW